MLVEYGENTAGGRITAEILADTLRLADRFRDHTAWIGAVDSVGPTALETSTSFLVKAGQHAAFRDTFFQLNAAIQAMMDAVNREKIARMARGT